MRLQINEALFEAGGITTTFDEDEVKALRVSVEVVHDLFVGPSDVDHIIPHNPADFISYDPFLFMDRNGPNDLGEFEETWTKEQVLGFAAATYATARLKHLMSYSPDPEIRDPVLGTLFAAISAESEEEGHQIIRDFEDRQKYNPLEDTEAPDSPGRRVLLGFEAARVALTEVTYYPEAWAIVNTFNESILVS